MRELDSPVGSTGYVPTGRIGPAVPRNEALWGWVVLCDLVWEVSRPSGNVAALYDSRTYAHVAVSLDGSAHERPLPLVVSVDLIEVGEHLLGRAVDFDAVLDHGSDPLVVPDA
jgi:hypothetical protein